MSGLPNKPPGEQKPGHRRGSGLLALKRMTDPLGTSDDLVGFSDGKQVGQLIQVTSQNASGGKNPSGA